MKPDLFAIGRRFYLIDTVSTVRTFILARARRRRNLSVRLRSIVLSFTSAAYLFCIFHTIMSINITRIVTL